MNALTGYFLAGTAIVVLGLSGYIMWQRGNLIEARAQVVETKASLQIAIDANKQQEAAIAQMQAQEHVNQQAAVHLQAAVETVQTQSQQMSDAIAKLDKASADVRSFRNTATPADLRCLLAHKPVGCQLN